MFSDLLRRFAEGCQGVVALDGKTLRRSFDRASSTSPLHLVSAWAVEQCLVLAQMAVEDKSNEITAVPRDPVLPDEPGPHPGALPGRRAGTLEH